MAQPAAIPRRAPVHGHTDAKPLIVASKLGKTYGSGATAVHALRDVDLTIHRGDFLVFLGPSGCGKTTLLNIIGGLEAPSAGQIVVDGVDLARLDRSALTAYRRDKVGFVYQFFNLIPTLTARENVELAAQLGHEAIPVEQILRDVGLGHRIDNFPGEMSGGEQQRVAIARALVRRPPVLLCDEPTGELDLETGKKVLGILQRFNQELGITILLVTHNSVIARMAHHVVRMQGGSLASIEANPAPVEASTLSW